MSVLVNGVVASRCEVVRKCSLGANSDYGRQHEAQPQPPEMFGSRWLDDERPLT